MIMSQQTSQSQRSHSQDDGRVTHGVNKASGKSNGTCSVCFVKRQLHLKDGTVHLHGPRLDPCPGSNKPPRMESLSDLTTPQSTQSITSDSQCEVLRQTGDLADNCSNGLTTPSIKEFKHPCLQKKTITSHSERS
jgi:hypothetical protein